MSRRLLPNLSPGRQRWLQQLDREGRGKRARGAIGHDCMVLGWTDWIVRDKRTGEQRPYRETLAEAKASGFIWSEQFAFTGDERLTEPGRQILHREAS